MGDGIAIDRFSSRESAESWAAGKRCYAGAAGVDVHDVPKRLADRWGCCSAKRVRS
jgi:hypothetical protein